MPALSVILGMLLDIELIMNLLAILVFGISLCTNIERNPKTPLVYTSRVLRLCATMSILCLIAFILVLIHLPEFFIILAALLFFFLPLVMLLSNLINVPVEKMVNQHYINDAKRILKNAGSMKIIGITGSYGKTSVKYYLSFLLKAKYNVLMTPGNYNTTLGVVRTLRENYSPINNLFVCEMGARGVGEIKEICDLVHPDAGIITAIGEQHLETFKSLENIKRTKYELADSLTENSPLFLNGDDSNIMSVPHKKNAIIYGIQNKEGYYADSIEVSETGTNFTVHTPQDETQNFSTRLLGEHNVLNIVGAIAAAHTFGIDLPTLATRVKKLEGVPHRLQLIRNEHGIIIDDAYNSNPQGAKAALNVLKMFPGVKILITPGMVELGEMQSELNHQLGIDASKACDYIILVGKTQTKPIQDGVLSGNFPQEHLLVVDSFQDAMAQASNISTTEKKIILLENDLPDNY